MRTLRILLVLCLGVVVGAVVAYYVFLSQRGPQPVMSVYPTAGVLPMLQDGEVLKWQGAPATSFTVYWIGASPCTTAGPLPSSLDGNTPTVTCKVKNGISNGQNFYYYNFDPPTETNVAPAGRTTPCYGCTSIVSPTGNQNGASLDKKVNIMQGPAVSGFPGQVGVACLGNPSGVSPIPPIVQALQNDQGAQVTWSPNYGVTSLDSAPKFTGSSPKCSPSGGQWTCQFDSKQDYSNLTYTIAATGPSCGATPGSGKITSPN
jgi:hypothetical protein